MARGATAGRAADSGATAAWEKAFGDAACAAAIPARGQVAGPDRAGCGADRTGCGADRTGCGVSR
ncbi:MAG TPA: hypothetical protein VE733_30865, partial [Streptosporangiaceae bacterium]|nr:hypothetical protein [Streptosporangiaceae bacterium]